MPESAMQNSTPGSGTPEHTQRAAERHHHRENDRQQPHGGSAEIGAPETDRHHRRDVVQTRERVEEPADETADAAGLRMRAGDRGREKHQREGRQPAQPGRGREGSGRHERLI